MNLNVISIKDYRQAKKIVKEYERQHSITTKSKQKKLNPKIAEDLIQLLTGKKLGDRFDHRFAYHKGYRNDFEGYVENPGIIEGISEAGVYLNLKFFTGNYNLSRNEQIWYKYINQSTKDYCNKYQLCTDTEFILKIISEQMFQHFISWYGPNYTGNCTNMYRMVEDVIDDWNCFIIKSKALKKHSTYIIQIFKDFSSEFYDKMPKDMKKRIGTNSILYKRKDN